MSGPPLRIGFVIDSLTPGAGTENQLLFLLRSFDRARIEPHLACLVAPPDGAPLPGIEPACVLGVRKLASPAGLRGLAAYRTWLRRRRLQGIVTFFRDANIVGTIGAIGTGVPVASSRRNIGGGYWHTPGEIRLLRLLNRATRLWIANGAAVREYTAAAEGVDPSRIRIIPNAVDLQRFRPPRPEERDEIRRAHSLETGAAVVACVANFRPIKGVDVLVEAISRVRSASSGPYLLLAGAGPGESALREQAARLGIADRVRFLGLRDDVNRILWAADLAVLPSRGEGFSNALLEYGAAGLAAVATEAGGNREWIETSGGCLAVPIDDPTAMAAAIESLFADPGRRAALGAAGRRHVEARHAPGRVLRRWEEILTELAGAPVSGGSGVPAPREGDWDS